MSDKPIFITTTLPYVNAEPHIGFALELVQADVLARYFKLLGREVLLNTGTDEHGSKIYQKALGLGMRVEDYVDSLSRKFRDLLKVLNIDQAPESFRFIRTTDPIHIQAAQEFWRQCKQAGDIYKKRYQIKYCVGCELEKTDSELENGICPLHPNLEIELIDEENYFFRFSKYQAELLALYQQANFVIPETRAKEISSFVEGGLEDFSISRLKSKMPWGIPVPEDDDQVMYVWFDALVNYISTLGWPKDKNSFNYWWEKSGGAIQLAGKDNLRQQSAMWQAMLKSVGLPSSKQIFIHGFFTSGGQKMSKSLGNVVDPIGLVSEYGAEAVRYFLTRKTSPFEDTDYTPERFKEAYNSDLANGLGNLVSRVLKMSESYEVERPKLGAVEERLKEPFFTDYREQVEQYRFDRALDFVWMQIKEADLYIQNTTPFKLFKTDPKEARKHVVYLLGALGRISAGLAPFMPETAKKIDAYLRGESLVEPLFLRRD